MKDFSIKTRSSCAARFGPGCAGFPVQYYGKWRSGGTLTPTHVEEQESQRQTKETQRALANQGEQRCGCLPALAERRSSTPRLKPGACELFLALEEAAHAWT